MALKNRIPNENTPKSIFPKKNIFERFISGEKNPEFILSVKKILKTHFSEELISPSAKIYEKLDYASYTS